MAASRLKWQLLTKKRGSSTQGVPAGKEHLAWVTNTVTLIHGERDAVLVDSRRCDGVAILLEDARTLRQRCS
jgi:hypothetical protein